MQRGKSRFQGHANPKNCWIVVGRRNDLQPNRNTVPACAAGDGQDRTPAERVEGVGHVKVQLRVDRAVSFQRCRHSVIGGYLSGRDGRAEKRIVAPKNAGQLGIHLAAVFTGSNDVVRGG